jgi:hypothetical protein
VGAGAQENEKIRGAEMNDGDMHWYRYVPWALVEAYQALGWVLEGDMGPVMRVYRAIMRWAGQGEPVEPK